jgi:GNAT superfamily N-acetyltransferase
MRGACAADRAPCRAGRAERGGVIDVRDIQATDAPVWHRLWRAYLDFYRVELPERVYETTFARLVDPVDPAQHGLLATRDGEGVGIANLIFHRHGWQVEDICYLQDLYVAEAARGIGAGRALIEAVYEQADARGAVQVYWLTHGSNAQARKLYDRVGTETGFIKYRR